MNSKADLNEGYQSVECTNEREVLQQQLIDYLEGSTEIFSISPECIRLNAFANIFSLNNFEKEIIGTLWICLYSPEIRRHIIDVSGCSSLSALAIARVLKRPPIYQLGIESPLVAWEIVKEQLLSDSSLNLHLDTLIVNWLEEKVYLDPWLINCIQPIDRIFHLNVYSFDKVAEEIKQTISTGSECKLNLITSDRVLAKNVAAHIAEKIGLPIIGYDIKRNTDINKSKFFLRAQRYAYLNRCIPFYSECIDSELSISPINSFPLQIMMVENSGLINQQFENRTIKKIYLELDPLTQLDRQAIWLKVLPACQSWSKKDQHNIFSRAHLSATEIDHIASKQPKNIQDINRILREQTNHELSELAQRIHSKFKWDDLVVEDDVKERLSDIIFEAKTRNELWEDKNISRLFPQGRGLVALFSGPPGAGKTMAAQVVANELGLDLLRIDLSTLVSKWVGETIENIQTVLSAKVSRQSVVFFDEADALFGRRIDEVKDANDRYMNMDSGHLMVALENFDGIVLMASNLKGNIDPAFIRRIRHAIEFKKPNKLARSVIWERCINSIFGENIDIEPNGSLATLANIEATGSQIKNATFASLLYVKRSGENISLLLLGRMLCRELAKDGRGLSERELCSILQESSI